MSPSPPVPSPCIKICRLHPVTRYCEGCLRSPAEIARWAYAEDEEKLTILDRLSARRSAMALEQVGPGPS